MIYLFTPEGGEGGLIVGKMMGLGELIRERFRGSIMVWMDGG